MAVDNSRWHDTGSKGCIGLIRRPLSLGSTVKWVNEVPASHTTAISDIMKGKNQEVGE